jgi:hypothetical protein
MACSTLFTGLTIHPSFLNGPGLPDDGIFSNQNDKFGYLLGGLGTENVVIFYGHLLHFTAICYILLKFGIFYGPLVLF